MSEQPLPLTGRRRQAAVNFILVTVMLDVLGFGIIIPVLPRLIQQMMGGDAGAGAEMHSVFLSVWALMQFIFSPLLGAISDRYGRRYVILISCFGLGLDYIVMALAPTVWWLLLGRILSGICASSFATSGAYIADVSPPEKRAAAFGMMGAAFGIGFVIGPGVGGFLGDIDPRLPFWGSAVLALLSAAYGWFVLPESLPPEKRDSFSWRKANPVGSFNLLRSHPELLGLAGVYFLFQMAHYVLPSMYVIYTGYRYGWSSSATGTTLMAVGVLSAIVQGGLLKQALKRLGERGSLLTGLFFGIAGFSGFALAPTGFWMWAALPVFALWGLLGPSLQSLMSKHVSPYEQGKLQGACVSIGSLAGLVAPSMFARSFAHFIDKGRAWTLPGVPFFLAAALLILALLLTLQVLRREPPSPLPEPAA